MYKNNDYKSVFGNVVDRRITIGKLQLSVIAKFKLRSMERQTTTSLTWGGESVVKVIKEGIGKRKNRKEMIKAYIENKRKIVKTYLIKF